MAVLELENQRSGLAVQELGLQQELQGPDFVLAPVGISCIPWDPTECSQEGSATPGEAAGISRVLCYRRHPNPLLLSGDIPGVVSHCGEFRECPRAWRHGCFAGIPTLELLPALFLGVFWSSTLTGLGRSH